MKGEELLTNICGAFGSEEKARDWLMQRRGNWARDNGYALIDEPQPGYTKAGENTVREWIGEYRDLKENQPNVLVYWTDDTLIIQTQCWLIHELEIEY